MAKKKKMMGEDEAESFKDTVRIHSSVQDYYQPTILRRSTFVNKIQLYYIIGW